jgi:hypothetical protein
MIYIRRTVRFRPVSVRKNYQPVSRILFPRRHALCIDLRVAIIYLAPVLLQGSSCLPSGIGRAALSRRYTWHFSMQGLPAPAVTCRRRGLLPHVFNLTARLTPGGSYFLWHSLWTCKRICRRATRPPALNRCIALCCPDFPPPDKQGAMTRLVAAIKIQI